MDWPNLPPIIEPTRWPSQVNKHIKSASPYKMLCIFGSLSRFWGANLRVWGQGVGQRLYALKSSRTINYATSRYPAGNYQVPVARSSVHFELHAGWTGFMRATGHKNIIPRLQTIVPPNRRLIVQHRLYFNTFDYEGHLKKNTNLLHFNNWCIAKLLHLYVESTWKDVSNSAILVAYFKIPLTSHIQFFDISEIKNFLIIPLGL